MASNFDPELIELTFYPDQDLVSRVEVYKVGGGTRGRKYTGFWGYRLSQGDRVIGSGDDLYTGMPKTHSEAVQIALDHFQSEQA